MGSSLASEEERTGTGVVRKINCGPCYSTSLHFTAIEYNGIELN